MSGGALSDPLVHFTSGLCFNQIVFRESQLQWFGAVHEYLVVKLTGLYLSF